MPVRKTKKYRRKVEGTPKLLGIKKRARERYLGMNKLRTVATDYSEAEFEATRTGRIVKSSPAAPRLGEDQIEAAVRAVVEAE